LLVPEAAEDNVSQMQAFGFVAAEICGK